MGYPFSTFGLSILTTFISGSPLFAIPSNPSALTAVVLAAAASPHGSATAQTGEAPLSRGLRPGGLLHRNASVGYWGQNPRFGPPKGGRTATHATSCRTARRISHAARTRTVHTYTSHGGLWKGGGRCATRPTHTARPRWAWFVHSHRPPPRHNPSGGGAARVGRDPGVRDSSRPRASAHPPSAQNDSRAAVPSRRQAE